LFLPTLTLWATIFTIKMGKDRYLLLVSLFMQYQIVGIFKLLSKSSYAVILLIYTLIFHRRDIFLYKILAFMLLSLAKVAILIKATIIVILFFALQIFRDRVSIENWSCHW